MARKAEYKNPPADPTNQWVRDALAYAGIGQTELAARLHDLKIISSPDRSVVQKMTVGRKVTAKEMLAISQITGLPTPKEVSYTHALEDVRRRFPDARPEAVEEALSILLGSRKTG